MNELGVKEIPKRLRKPKVGKNEAKRNGAGPHKSARREQNRLFKQINEELDLKVDESP